MIFDFLTGLLGAVFIGFSLSYVLRRQWNKQSKANKRKLHCISGYAGFFIVLIHIHLKFLDFKWSAGFLSFIALLFIALTGFLKQRFRKKRQYYWIHVALAVVFVMALFIHIGQQIINLLLM